MCYSLTLVLYHYLTQANRYAPQSSEAKQCRSLQQIFNAIFMLFYYCESAFWFDKTVTNAACTLSSSYCLRLIVAPSSSGLFQSSLALLLVPAASLSIHEAH